MKAEQIMDALQFLREGIIEETARVRNGRRTPERRKRWGLAALAACLCVVVGLSTARYVERRNDLRITAEKITEFSGSGQIVAGGITTTAYRTQKAQSLDALMKSPVRDNSTVKALPVYYPAAMRNVEVGEYVQEKAVEYAEKLGAYLGVPAEAERSSSNYWTYSVGCGKALKGTLRASKDSGALQLQYILRDPEREGALLDTALPADATDEEIMAATSVVLDVFTAVLGKNFEARTVHRSTSVAGGGKENIWVYVYGWETGEDPAQQLYNTYLDYVYISFTNEYSEDPDILQLTSAWNTETELKPLPGGGAPLLSVEEAEEYLERGYIFLGHVCPVCIGNNEAVDFSDYDGVEIVYRGSTFYTYNIPFYAFYKQTGEESFAVTYVPAVKVEGLEEYFAEQEAWHNTN